MGHFQIILAINLKKMIKSNNRVNEQLFNRIGERNKLMDQPTLKSKRVIVQVATRNSCFILKDKSVVEVFNVCEDEDELHVHKYLVVNDFFSDPIKSGDLGIFFVSNLDSNVNIVKRADIF